MLQKRAFWYGWMGGCLFFWLVLILAGFVIPYRYRVIAQAVTGLLLALHVAEIPIARTIARDRGLTFFRTVVKTLLFGFFWWVPLDKGVINK